ncbi:RNA polymerase sigma-70 factor, ECF subfamily [Rhodoferax sp. OV413]|uniref:sigma-70 family RNA polymerase sigma factor n=1 Tax=Rhodoferax sp. OV413 TaxID=1855285 RepID=UPI00088E2D72|nr:sigma-70 family RNA polymerase sigma factor [Rhodoferax sp. OV413]SDN94147.1 RNA polymerase sigma-70 factor, ECF subfamily [Rhodoferax sp. OV413]
MNVTRYASFPTVETLYGDHHGWLQGWLRRKLGNACDAADLAQDTFVRLLAKRETPELQEPRAYLSTIAKGLVADFFRRQDLERAYLEVLATLPEASMRSPETRAILLEALTAIDAMLDGMKPVVRQAFLLSQLEGLGYAEIAEQLGISVRTVNNYMCKAIEHCYLLAP